MIGINIETLNSIMSRTSDSNDNYSYNSKDLSNTIDDLKSCYRGSALNFLFNGAFDSISQLDKIKKVLASYIDILEDVKKSYVKQDEIFKQQLNHISSSL